MIRKLLKWIFGILGSFICLALITILILSQLRNVIYKEFIDASNPGVAIPGLNLKLCPQGVAYAEEPKTYLFVGYMTDNSASKLHTVDEQNNVKMFNLKNADNTPHLGHVGGIATTGNHVFITGESLVYHLLLSDVLAQESGADVILNDSFAVSNAASYAFANANKLYIGEFYRSKGYHTDPSHTIQVDEKETHHALVFEYNLDATARYGVEEVPSKIYSVIDEVQGFAVTASGRFILSCSYSIVSSRLHIYSALSGEPDLMFNLNSETQVPLYHLNKNRQENKYDLMPMSEDLDYKNGVLYINFESASKKYKMFNMYQTKTVYTLNID